jgi:hypothetical protein
MQQPQHVDPYAIAMKWRSYLVILFSLLFTTMAQAQLTGTKVVGTGGDYATLTAAVNDLNTQGVGAGGVIFSIKGGHTETVANGNATPNPDVPAGLLITKGGTAANPVVIQWDGTLTKPVFTAGNGIGNYDFVIGIAGQDYITIDGLKIVENTAGHTTNALRAEMGIALFKERYNTTLGNNGCQFVTIKNCEITLTRFPNAHQTVGYTYFPFMSAGIKLLHWTSTHQGSNSIYYWSLSNPNQGIKSAADVHSNNTIVNNSISDCFFGISLNDAWLKSGANLYAGTGNVIGRSGEGNSITNFGPLSSGVNYSGAYYIATAAINVGGQKDFSIEYNNISGCVSDQTGSSLNMFAGIWAGTGIGGGFALPRSTASVYKINNNTITNINTSNLANNTKAVMGINFTANNSGSEIAAGGGNVEINNNTITNLTGVRGNVIAINSNIINSAVTTLSTNYTAGYQTNGTVSINQNTISGLARLGSNVSALISAVYWKHGSRVLTINDNKITNFTLGTTSLQPASTTTGMQLIYTYSSYTNVIRETVEVQRNKIDNCDVLGLATGTTAMSFSGIHIQRGATSNLVKKDTITNCDIWSGGSTNSAYYIDIMKVKGEPKSGTSTVTIDSCQLINNARTGVRAAAGYGYQNQLRGIVCDFTTGNQNRIISNNIIDGLQTSASVFTPTSYVIIRGIYTKGKYTTGNTTSIWGNTIRNLGGVIGGYSRQATNNVSVYYSYPLAAIASEYYNILNIYRNNITNMEANAASTGYTSDGNYASGPCGITTYNPSASYTTTQHIYNNFISDLRAPAMRGRLAINGIVLGGLTYRSNVYHNTIVLGAADGGATGRLSSTTAGAFGVTGILVATYYYNSKTYATDIRNNIISVNATSSNTAASMCVRNLNITTAKKVPFGLAKTNTGNVYFINPDLRNYIYGQGTIYNTTGGIRNCYAYTGATTNATQNLVNDNAGGSSNFNTQCGLYKTFMAGAEKQSYAELTPGNVPVPPPFVNAGTPSDNLALITGSVSSAFNAARITTPVDVSTDYFTTARGATKVTAGAHETTGILPAYISGTILFDFVPVNDSICGGNKPLKVTITPPDGKTIATDPNFAPRLYYRRIYNNNTTAAASIDANSLPTLAQNSAASGHDGWRFVNPASVTGNVFDFDIDISKLNNTVATTPVYTIEYFLIAQTSDGAVCSWSSGDWSLNTNTTCPGTVQLEGYTPIPVPADPSSTDLTDNSVQDNYTVYRGQDLTRGLEMVNNGLNASITGTSGSTSIGTTANICLGDNARVTAHYSLTATGELVNGSSYRFEVADNTAFTAGVEQFDQLDSTFTYVMSTTTTKYIRAHYLCGGSLVANTNTPYATVTAAATPANTSTLSDRNSCENQSASIALSSTATPSTQSRYYWLVSPKKKVFPATPSATTLGTTTLNVTPGDTIHSGTWSSYVTVSLANAINNQGYKSSLLDGSESATIDTGKGIAFQVHNFIRLKSVVVKAITGDGSTTDGFRVSLYSQEGLRLYTQANSGAIADGALKTLTLTNWYIAPGNYLLVMEPTTPGVDPVGGLAYVSPEFPILVPGTGTPAYDITSGVAGLTTSQDEGLEYSQTDDYNYFFDLSVDAYCTSSPINFNWTINPASCCSATPVTAVGLAADGTASAELATTNCRLVSGWYYFFDPANPNILLAAVNPNGNAFDPTSMLINNSGVTGDADHKKTDGINVTEVMPYTLQIDHTEPLTVNGGVIVRFFYPSAQKASIDGLYANRTWFKFNGSKQDILDNLTALDAPGKELLTPSTTGTENGIPFVEFSNVQSFSTFGYIGSTSTIILPVVLSKFEITAKDCSVLLAWTSTEETNFAGYEIEQSYDGRNFVSVATVPANGVPGNYEKLLPVINTGSLRTYFRLKLNDVNGSFRYTAILNIVPHCTTAGKTIDVYPNPTTSFTWLQLNLPAGNYQAEVFNITGLLIQSIQLNVQAQGQMVPLLEKGHYSKGQYLIRVTSKATGKSWTEKFLVQ